MWRHTVVGLLLALALLFAGWDMARGAGEPTAPAAKATRPASQHEAGRAVYNYRCYFCHGYSGDARTLAATYLQPLPRDFTAAPLPRERILQALRHGRPGTAMKSFAGVLDDAEIVAVAAFVEREFMQDRKVNTRYHTAANGWPRHERYAAAFPFARGEIALDTPVERLTPAQRSGRSLFLGSCVSCHDRARVDDEGPAWSARPVSFPRRGFVPGQPNLPPPVDAVSSASVYARHEIPPPVDGLPPAQRRGAALFQTNCAFCHGGDGTGKNWIGQFMEPPARPDAVHPADDAAGPAAPAHPRGPSGHLDAGVAARAAAAGGGRARRLRQRRALPAACGLGAAGAMTQPRNRRTWLRWAAATGGAAALGGCATRETEDAPARLPLWPAPPELPRYAYEAVLRDARSLQAATDGGRLRDWLTGDPSRGGIGKPLAVAAAAGRVYVTDTEARRVFVFDLPRRRVFTFGTRLEGELRKPAGIDVDGRGQVYVVDSTARRLVVYDALGLYLRHIDGSALWTRPTAVAVTADGQRVHVVDTGGVASARHQVTVHDADGRLLHTLGRRGSAAGEFNLPADATVGRDGRLWVLDAGNFRVQGFDRSLQPVAAFGTVGNGLGQFARPRGIAADRDGLLYVADALLCNVQVFRPDGALLLALGQRATADAPGRYLLPSRVACDETGRVYVVDQYLHKVEVLRRLPEEEARRLQGAG